MPTTFTSGDLSKHFGVPVWQIVRVVQRGFLPEPARIGSYRVWTEADLPAIEQALRAAGYLQREAAHA